MIRDEQGSMSAFLAMLFLVFLLLISVCVEGIYMYTARGKAMGIYMSGLSHTKGNYQKELADMYHIYAMDPRYHKKIETDFSDRMKESLDQNGDPFRFQTGSTKISDILDLSAQKGEVLKYQIRQQLLINQLNSLQGAGINAIIFRVRAEADALYKSSYEPWSRFLTGEIGRAHV